MYYTLFIIYLIHVLNSTNYCNFIILPIYNNNNNCYYYYVSSNIRNQDPLPIVFKKKEVSTSIIHSQILHIPKTKSYYNYLH